MEAEFLSEEEAPVNFGTPVPLLIGIVLIVGAVALFFLDKLKPGFGRDADKVYAILWLISGVFLLGHLNMELLASFQQLLMTGMLIAITVENIVTRKPKPDPYGPAVEPPRPEPYRPSRAQSYRSGPRMNVRAELENDPYLRDAPVSDRRALGMRDERPSRDRSLYYSDEYSERYEDDRRYPDTEERSIGRLTPGSDRIRRRRPKTVDNRYGTDVSETWDESPSRYDSGQGGGYSSHSSSASLPPSSYPTEGSDRDSYVDYRSVDYPEDKSDRPSNDYGRRY